MRLKSLTLAGFLAAALISSATPITATAEQAGAAQMWTGIHKDVFGTRDIADAGDKIQLDLPIRAEDAATVPFTIKMPASFAASVTALTLVIDNNPSPVVATFKFGEAGGKGDRMLSTRVRIDQYSDVRAIAETADGKLYMASRFVKASGGCSAPASRDAEEAAKTLGKMQVKTALIKDAQGLNQEAQVMIKHPNNSGLQMDQLTGLYSKAHYINKVEVKTGGRVVFTMDGGISISEDPNFRFTYEGKPGDPMEVHAEDSEGNAFNGRSAANPS